MLLVVTYSTAARTDLRNICRSHDDEVVRRFGRAALLESTTYAAFLALRLRAVHGGDVQIERTTPFNEFTAVSESVRAAANAYATRESRSTPYAAFASGTDHPAPETMKEREL